MGLLSKAKAAAPAGPVKKKKQTVWLVATDLLKKAIKDVIAYTVEQKNLEAKSTVLKTTLKNHAVDEFIKSIAHNGVFPETPLLLQNEDGQTVTFVVSDMTASTRVTDEQVDSMNQLLGADRAADLFYQQTTFSFDSEVLALPGVSEAVEKALDRVVARLTTADDSGKALLTQEQAEMLISAKTITAFRPGTVQRMPEICGRDVVTMKEFFKTMGSALKHYIKA